MSVEEIEWAPGRPGRRREKAAGKGVWKQRNGRERVESIRFLQERRFEKYRSETEGRGYRAHKENKMSHKGREVLKGAPQSRIIRKK